MGKQFEIRDIAGNPICKCVWNAN